MSEASPDDLERWIASFRGPLVGLLASWGLDWRAAEELAQDVFAEAWVGRARFTAEPGDLDAVGAWLRGIAFHLWRAQQRQRDRRAAQSIDAHQVADAAAPDAVPFDEDDERRTMLVVAFGHLSEPFQTVLRMHYLEDSSAREVAALLGITPKAVESRLYQARRALRQRVDWIARGSATGARR